MNRKQLIFIFLALALLGGASLLLLNHHDAAWSSPQGKMGEKLFPGFPLNDIAAIRIQGAGEVHLARKGGVWKVRERGDYPANFSQISGLLLKLQELKISQSEAIGPSQMARMELQPPGQGAGSGTLLELKDEPGKILQSVLLGKKHMELPTAPSRFRAEESANGRYLLRTGDTQDLLLVSDPLEDVETDVESWLNHDFFKIEKPQSISLAAAASSNSWKLTRPSEADPWVLSDTNAGEILDTNKVSSLSSALSYASFVDVASNAAPAQTGMDHPMTATVTTFDHLTYELKIGAKTPENNYYLSVSAAGDPPAARTPGKDEKPEDKAKLDKEFEDKTKTLKDKLAQEKSLGPWVYVVSSGLIDPVIRSRARLMVDKNEDKPAAAADTAAPPAAVPDLSPAAPANISAPTLEPAK